MINYLQHFHLQSILLPEFLYPFEFGTPSTLPNSLSHSSLGDYFKCFTFIFFSLFQSFHFHFQVWIDLSTTFTFQNILFSVGSAFLYYVNHFKLYSSFCASHSKAQKVLHPSKGAAPGRCPHYFFIISKLFLPFLPALAALYLHMT